MFADFRSMRRGCRSAKAVPEQIKLLISAAIRALHLAASGGRLLVRHRQATTVNPPQRNLSTFVQKGTKHCFLGKMNCERWRRRRRERILLERDTAVSNTRVSASTIGKPSRRRYSLKLPPYERRRASSRRLKRECPQSMIAQASSSSGRVDQIGNDGRTMARGADEFARWRDIALTARNGADSGLAGQNKPWS